MQVSPFLLSFCLSLSTAFYFHVGEREEKCIIEDVPRDTLIAGRWEARPTAGPGASSYGALDVCVAWQCLGTVWFSPEIVCESGWPHVKQPLVSISGHKTGNARAAPRALRPMFFRLSGFLR